MAELVVYSTLVVLSLFDNVVKKSEDDAGYTTLHLVEGVQHNPLQGNDFGAHVGKNISGGSIPYGSIMVNAYNDMSLNAIGIGWINKTGITKFCLRLVADIDNSEPTGDNSLAFYSANRGDGFKPKLTIIYTPKAVISTATISKSYALSREGL